MDDDQRKTLLQIALAAIEDEMGGDRTRPVPSMSSPVTDTGAFVTLRHGKRLRGCIGTFQPDGTLAQTVDRVARLACKDPRFVKEPITLDELSDINIEVSVLGPLERVDHPESLDIGRHGILIRSGEASGCFLPHVGVECGWTPEEFLSTCCSMKAGLSEDAWRQPETKVYLFTAEVFGEKTQKVGKLPK